MVKGLNLSFDNIMALAGLGIAGLVIYEIYVNQSSIQAAIQGALTPQTNIYQQQGYYCPYGGTPGPTGLCPNGQMAINASQQAGISSMTGGCSDGSIPNPATGGRCANGSLPMAAGGYGSPYGQSPYGYGYGSTSVCNDGSQPNPINGLCANGSYPTTVGTGVNNAMMNPYGAQQYVNPTIAGGTNLPGETTFTDPTTGQVYDPTTGALLTPGGSYVTPSLASPYTSIFPTLTPLQGQGIYCGDGSSPSATGICANGQQAISTGTVLPQTSVTPPQATTIQTSNPTQTGTMGCADGSTPTNGLCANGQQPTTMLPAGTTTSPSGTVPVTATPTPAPAPAPAPAPTTTITPATTTQPTTQTSTQPVTGGGGGPGGGGGGGGGGSGGNQQQFNRYSGQQQGGMRTRFGYMGYQSEGAMISAQAFGHVPRDPNRASVTSYSSIRPKIGNSPITTEVFGRRFYTPTPIYVSGIR